MNGIEKLIKTMRIEGSRNNPSPLVLGEMTSPKKCNIKGMEFEGDDLYIAEHLMKHEIEVSITDWNTKPKSGETTTYLDFIARLGEVELDKTKVTVSSSLKAGDTVLCYRIADDKYVIIEKVVSG